MIISIRTVPTTRTDSAGVLHRSTSLSHLDVDWVVRCRKRPIGDGIFDRSAEWHVGDGASRPGCRIPGTLGIQEIGTAGGDRS
jgi:hypothetical protein